MSFLTFTPPKPILKTMIVNSDSRKSATSGIARGMLGGFVLGPIGALGGALSAKNKQRATFLIVYKDGTRETRTVNVNGLEFNEYVKYL